MGSSPHLWFCACKSATLAHEILVSIGPSPLLWFLHAKQRLLDQYTSLYGYQTSPVVLCIQNSVNSTGITSFNGFHPSSVVLCIQNCGFTTKIACLYGSQTSPVVLCMQYSDLMTTIALVFGSQTSPVTFCTQTSLPSLYRSQPSSVFFACKTAPFGPDLLVCICPRPHLRFWALITAC